MTPRAKTRLKIWLVVVGVFVLGGVTGASLDSLYRLRANGNGRAAEMRGERRNKEDIFERMKSDLNLTDQQATEIHAILDQARNDYRQLRAEVRPRYDAARQNARTKIRALLTPEQQQKFDAKVAEHDAKRDREDK
ncbi:MAG: motif family protein [Acidobacteriota bacterium]|jgi:Spy/CpxP family protein refolding chaperone|nr:motif family protein [Acidobacteriota bacterium]